jgi:hypothetical protein
MPMGAVIFVDFWLVERAGLKSGWAARRGLDFNWAAGAAWFVTLAACAGLVLFGGVDFDGKDVAWTGSSRTVDRLPAVQRHPVADGLPGGPGPGRRGPSTGRAFPAAWTWR